MLTGDALPIAQEIGRDVGIGDKIVKISELKELTKSNQVKATELAERSNGFVEVYPEDKYFIVNNFIINEKVIACIINLIVNKIYK